MKALCKRYVIFPDDWCKLISIVVTQGIIDAYIEKEDYIILVDYKTDRKKSEQELIEKYSLQLSYYTEALEAALQKRVAKKYIWSCRLNKALEL